MAEASRGTSAGGPEGSRSRVEVTGAGLEAVGEVFGGCGAGAGVAGRGDIEPADLRVAGFNAGVVFDRGAVRGGDRGAADVAANAGGGAAGEGRGRGVVAGRWRGL